MAGAKTRLIARKHKKHGVCVMTIAENVLRVRERIASAALRASRDPNDITLVAASKTMPTPKIREAFESGIRVFGENRVQEITQKMPENAYSSAELRFIGTLQSNKINALVGVCRLIESVPDARYVELIAKRAKSLGITQDILIEVNIGAEKSKSGIAPERIDEALSAAGDGGVRILGLMAIPPADAEISVVHGFFSKMQYLFVDISEKKYDNVSMQVLSMGMSDTFEAAILEGATSIRVGTAIFGPRKV